MPTMHVPDGPRVAIKRERYRRGGGVNLDVETSDGRRWRIAVAKSGRIIQVLESWEGGEIADVELPEWIDDVLVRLEKPERV